LERSNKFIVTDKGARVKGGIHSYGVDVSAMLVEQRGWDIHALSSGRLAARIA
jgi:hypothetical protein